MATIEVPATVYAAMRAILAREGRAPEGELLNLDGYQIRSKGGPPTDDVTVGSLLSARTHEGRVELGLNTEVTQMDLDKAREIARMLHEVIEAAVTDQIVYAFLTTRAHLPHEAASLALLDLRELRQGSRTRVHPS